MDGKIIGFDHSGNAISMVVLTYARGERQIAACEQVLLTNGDDWTGVAEAIARIQQKVDTRDAACVASFPEDWISHRIIAMPFADRKKISRIIAYEIEPLLPFPIGDMIIDFQPLPSSQTTDSGIDFFAAAASKTRLKEFIEKLNTLGFEPEVITSRGFVVTSVLSAYKDAGLFVDGDGQRLVAGGFTGGKVRFIYSLTTGQPHENRAQGVVDALRHVLIADEERQQVDFKPDNIYVSGDLCRLDGMKETIESSLGIATDRMDTAAVTGLLSNGCADDAGVAAGGFDAAFCLALLKRVNRPFINFRKDEFAVTGKWRQYGDVIIRTGLIAAVVIIIGFSGFYYDLKSSRERIAAIETSKIEVFTEAFPGVPIVDDPYLQMKVAAEQLKGKIALPPEMRRKAYCIDILNDISRFVPPDHDVVVERLVVGPDDVILSGSTESFNAVDALKSEFGKSPLFGKIDISSATMSKIDKRVSFKLRLELL